MNASEYVAKALEDKKYLEDVVGHLSDKVVSSIQNEGEGVNMGQMSGAQIMAYILGAAAPAMGVAASQQEIDAECERQCPAAKFANVRMLLRVGRMITKEYRKRKL